MSQLNNNTFNYTFSNTYREPIRRDVSAMPNIGRVYHTSAVPPIQLSHASDTVPHCCARVASTA